MADTIPVTLLTGFLGAGKSTLLGRILRDPRFSDTAVVVNEFGEVGLDGRLVEHAPDQSVEMTSGCLCCTIRGDIRDTLLRLYDRAERGEVGMFSRLIVETTGLADPAPVIQTLMQDPRLVRRFSLAGVVTLVDSMTGSATLDRHVESVKQAALADRIVITKRDLAGAEGETLERRLQALNPAAPRLDAHGPDFDLRRLFETAAFDPAARSLDARAWLNAEAYPEVHDHDHDHGHDNERGHGHDNGHAHRHDHEHDHAHHHHDVNRHGPDIRAFSITLDEPVATMAFTAALELMIANQGPNLLRVKGLVHLAEKPDTPVAIHGVQHVFHDPLILPRWPDDDRRTRLVFITQGLAPQMVRAFFDAWGAVSPDDALGATV